MSIISSICTSAAITSMNAIVCINPNPKGVSRYACSRYVTIVDISITKVTAAPIPMAESIFWDTPKKGQMPRNCDRMILLTNTAVMNIEIYVSIVFEF